MPFLMWYFCQVLNNMAECDDLPLVIPVQSLSDHFICAVCMSQMKDSHLTPCGHRYCGDCIKECVNRRHKCPCCNNRIRVEDLIRDHQYDELVCLFNSEREKAEKKYFDNLINKAAETNQEESPSSFSPVENVLKSHVKKSLVAHERYYQELKREHKQKLAQLDADHQRLIEEAKMQGLTDDELEHQIADLSQNYQRHQEELDQELSECSQMVATAYDRYLTEHIPDLTVLPIKISLCILCKNVTVKDVMLKPSDSLKEVTDYLKSHMEAEGDEIIAFGENVKFFCFGPFSKYSIDEMTQKVQSIEAGGISLPDVTLLEDDTRLILRYGLKPKSTIVVYGSVHCKSDLPKQCFSVNFEANKVYKVDYFSCKECGINWVCRPCMEVCHKDHELVPYIMNHQPTWACCYCPKKKKCHLQGKPTQTSQWHKQWSVK